MQAFKPPSVWPEWSKPRHPRTATSQKLHTSKQKRESIKKKNQVTLQKTYVASDEAADGECGVGLGLDAGLGVNVGDVDLKDKV